MIGEPRKEHADKFAILDYQIAPNYGDWDLAGARGRGRLDRHPVP